MQNIHFYSNLKDSLPGKYYIDPIETTNSIAPIDPKMKTPYLNQQSRVFVSLLFFFFGLLQVSQAQDLHIYFDAQNSAIRYVLNGKEVSSPKVKKDGNIFLHIENYNNYLYDLEVQANNQVLQIPRGGGVSSLMGMIGGSTGMVGMSNPGGFNSGAGSGWTNLDGQMEGGVPENTFDEDNGFGFAGNTQTQEAGSMLQMQAVQLMKNMEVTETKFATIEEEVKKLAQRQELRDIVLEEVQKVKFNENLSPAQVKRMSMAFLERILDVKETEKELNLDYIIAKGDDRRTLEDKMRLLEKTQQLYINQIDSLKSTGEQMSQMSGSDEIFFQFVSTVNDITENSESVLESVDSEKAVIKQMYSTAGRENLQKMTSIWYEYEALANNDFSHVYRTEALGDRTILGVNFYKKDTMGNRRPAPVREPMSIKVPVYGGLKVNVSVGLNFGQFFTQPQNYFLQDTTIASEDGDGFLPIATSFVHFYPQRIDEVAIGGSFGIGIPLAGTNSVSAINFFLGPSFIFGKGQRIIINTGLMGGRVQQLSQGLKVGDALPPFAAIPTKNKYEVGYFVGVSFNINQ